MTIDELQILLDLNKGNENTILEEHCYQTDGNWLFVDSDDGKCWLFNRHGKMFSIKKFRHISIEMFYEDDKLKCIVIPDSVMSIGYQAFYNCSRLTSMTIPDGVTSIGSFAFFSCSRLMSVTIPNSMTRIGLGAFSNCSNLKNLVFKGKTLKQVKKMHYYPWGIKDEFVIKCES